MKLTNVLRAKTQATADGRTRQTLQALLGGAHSHSIDYSFYGRLIQSCSDRLLSRQGKQLHARLIAFSVVPDNFLASKLIAFYSKNLNLREARHVFDQIPNRNAFSWNALLIAYSSHQLHMEVLDLYHSFRLEEGNCDDCKPDYFTMTCVMKALSVVYRRPNIAKMIHCYILKTGLNSDVFVLNGLVSYYSRSEDVLSARGLFEEMPSKDVVSWNALISGYAQGGFFEECKELYREMLKLDGLKPCGVTAVSVLQACAQTSDLLLGMEVHRNVIDNNVEVDLSLYNAIIALYAKCGSLDYAREIFDEINEKDEITYGTMISGYMNHGFVKTAMNLFREMRITALSTWNAVISGLVQNEQMEGVLELVREMQSFGLRPNSVTISSILPVFSYLSSLKGAKEIHGYSIKNIPESSIYIATALIDTYGKVGLLQGAQRVFDQIEYKNVVVWTAIISAYAAHGDAKTALHLYHLMLDDGTQPDPVTFTAVLAACAHSGLVDEAWNMFNALSTKSGMPLVEHYACMVGVLCRAGKLSEAMEFISKMPMKPNAKVWGELLNGASVFGDLEVGKLACDHLSEMEPENTRNYISLSNLYFREGRLEEAEFIREKMRTNGPKNVAGSSWIETSKGLQAVTARDVLKERAEEMKI